MAVILCLNGEKTLFYVRIVPERAVVIAMKHVQELALMHMQRNALRIVRTKVIIVYMNAQSKNKR